MITDLNLQRAVFESLVRQGARSRFDAERFIAEDAGQPYSDVADYNYSPHPAVLAYWKNQWPPKEMAQLTSLTWDPTNDVQLSIWLYHDGEDGYFDIVSLQGIESLPRLESIRFEQFAAIRDLSPLLEVPTLAEVTLVDAIELSEWNKEVFSALRGRGVVVHINGSLEWPKPVPRPPPISAPRSPRRSDPSVRYPGWTANITYEPVVPAVWWDFCQSTFSSWAQLLGAAECEVPVVPGGVHKAPITGGAAAGGETHERGGTAKGPEWELQLKERISYWDKGGSCASSEFTHTLTVAKPGSRIRRLRLAGFSGTPPQCIGLVACSLTQVSPEARAVVLDDLARAFGEGTVQVTS